MYLFLCISFCFLFKFYGVGGGKVPSVSPGHAPDTYHKISQNITKYHKISQNITKYHKISQNITKYHKISQIKLTLKFYDPFFQNILKNTKTLTNLFKIFSKANSVTPTNGNFVCYHYFFDLHAEFGLVSYSRPTCFLLFILQCVWFHFICMLAILCCHTIDWDIFLRYWCLSRIYYYYYYYYYYIRMDILYSLYKYINIVLDLTLDLD